MALFRKSAAAARNGITPFKAGLIALVLVVVGTYFAYTRANPFADAYEFSAAFNTVNNLSPDSEVRIAGVQVGKVKTVEPMEGGEDGATVTMEIEQHGLPIHEDAELKVRPRIFLEGNEFVDLQPGTPSAPELDDGGTIPVNQTATPVQLGQILSMLQSDTREDLQTFLHEYASVALKKGGAEGFRKSIKYWEDAYKNTAIANEALLGTQPGDLFRVLVGQQRTFDALASVPDDLRNLVTNFNTTAAAFAAEDEALRATIPALRDVLRVGEPALASLNTSFPGIQRFAVDARPAARSSRTTIPEVFPFVQQLRLLFRPSELRGLARDLRQTVPPLARTNRRAIPFLNQNRALSRCTNRVLVPFARTPIPTGDPGPEPADSPDANPNAITSSLDFPYDPNSSGQPFMRQAARSFVGLSGESRTTDANGKFFRANFKLDTIATFFRPSTPALGDALLTLGSLEEDARPAPPPIEQGNSQLGHRRPHFRPDFPCERSVTPDLRSESATASAGGLDPLGQTIPTDQINELLEEGGLPPLPTERTPIDDLVGALGGAETEEQLGRALRRLEQEGEDGSPRSQNGGGDTVAPESTGGAPGAEGEE